MAPRRAKYDPASEPAWSYVATLPGGVKVTVREELARGRRLYLWWRAGGNWKKRALGEDTQFGYGLRDEAGEVHDDVAKWAAVKAAEQAAILAGDADALARAGQDVAPAAPSLLTLGGTRAILTDPDTGKYPHDTPHRRELLRQLDYAITALGADRPWAAIDGDVMTTLARRKVAAVVEKKRQGFRAAEVLVTRVAAIAVHLAEKKKIPTGCAVPFANWREDLRAYWRGLTKSDRDPKPFRPRYTVDEMRKLLSVAWDVDPRWGLLTALANEYRLGQARKARRSDVDLVRRQFTIIGSGKKEGAVVDLTDGQMTAVTRALEGYLAEYETRYQADGTDYRLFPAGHLLDRGKATARLGADANPGRPVSDEWMDDQHQAAEALAEIPHIKGRGPYGNRRVTTDANLAEGISIEGLQAGGGWSGPEVPMAIYRDQQNVKGRAEARDVRAKVRGEAGGEAPPKGADARTQDVHTDETPATLVSTPGLDTER